MNQDTAFDEGFDLFNAVLPREMDDETILLKADPVNPCVVTLSRRVLNNHVAQIEKTFRRIGQGINLNLPPYAMGSKQGAD